MDKLEKEIAEINKQYGIGSILRLGDRSFPIERLPLNIYSIDNILGGGLPRGRIIEIFGNAGSGKSSLCLHTVIAAQSAGLKCAFIDVEHSLDAIYAEKLGVNVTDLYIAQPSCAEEALDIAGRLIQTSEMGIIIVDSVSALVPRTELEGDVGDAHMGLQARLMSQAMRKLTGVVSKTNSILIFTNQIRAKFVPFGDPTTVSGGNALKFYSSIRLQMNALSAKVQENNKIIGYGVKITCVKNKTAPPYQTCNIDLIYGLGFDAKRDLINIGIEKKVIEQKGGWYYLGENKWHGKEDMINNINLNELKDLICQNG
jgi:recombination protein RecA